MLQKKSMMKRSLVVLFASMITLTGCTSSPKEAAVSPAGTTAPQASKEATAATAAPEAKKEPVKLKYTYWGSPQEKTAIENATKKFTEKFPWITVDPVFIPESDYDAKITAMVAGNESPDAGYMHSELGEAWQNEEKFVNINDLFANDKEVKKSDFLDYIWFNGTKPNYTYAISSAAESFAIFYNKDLFAEAKVEAPPAKAENAWTWDQFVAAAQKLTLDKNGKNAADPGFDPNNIKQFGVSFESWWGPIMAQVVNNGGDIISKDGKTFALDQPEAIEAIQRLADLINKYHVAPSPTQMKSIPSQAVALQSKIVAMSMHGQWINLDLGAAKVNYGIGALPKMKKSIAMGISGASVIYKSTKHLEETWMLTKFLADPAGAIDLYKGGLWMPTMKKWYTDPALVAQWAENNPAHPEGFKDAFMNNLLNNGVASAGYYLMNFGKVTDMTFSALDPVWLGKSTAEKALKELAPKVQPEIKGRFSTN